ncbi:MAG: hypothetical protein DRR00_06565 [Candidatus Parabeggiatoa sp. nov. 3]|nr:MAG: hypothetical protein DRR00_06565 [Gammaproteobacteria bacterium]
MVGKRAVKSGFIIEFIVARLPTLQFLGEKKVTKIPEQTLKKTIQALSWTKRNLTERAIHKKEMYNLLF